MEQPRTSLLYGSLLGDRLCVDAIRNAKRVAGYFFVNHTTKPACSCFQRREHRPAVFVRARRALPRRGWVPQQLDLRILLPPSGGEFLGC